MIRRQRLNEEILEQMQADNDMIPPEVNNMVEKQINIEFPPDNRYFGICHIIWARKKVLYNQNGYKWYSPAEMHPEIIYD